MKKILNYYILLTALALGLISLAPAFAAAETNLGTSVNAAATTNAGSAGAGATVSASASLTATETKAQTRGDNEITRRIAALNDAQTRVNAMQKVTDQFKQSVGASIQSQITALGALKTKIDADTDAATLKTDLKSITDSYRIFALVMPQIRISAWGDREVELVTMMSTLGSKLQARIQTAGGAGADVTALTAALTDMASKLSDAQTKATGAVSATASLTPDNGDAAKMKANLDALKQARTDLKAGQQDLIAARKDVDTIVKGLAKLNASAGASASTTMTH
jgi:hypothetical protein